jgi:hypothetical protein
MKPIVAALITAVTLAALTAKAQQKPQQSAPAAAPPAEEPYQPGLSEIMALQQMRHLKLWFAGRDGNWPLADYEIGELGDGFNDVSKLLGGDIAEQHVGAPMKALAQIIADKNLAAFPAAFDKLSAGCNTCHATLDHGFIVIQRPTLLPYSDQAFAPQR